MSAPFSPAGSQLPQPWDRVKDRPPVPRTQNVEIEAGDFLDGGTDCPAVHVEKVRCLFEDPAPTQQIDHEEDRAVLEADAARCVTGSMDHTNMSHSLTVFQEAVYSRSYSPGQTGTPSFPKRTTWQPTQYIVAVSVVHTDFSFCQLLEFCCIPDVVNVMVGEDDPLEVLRFVPQLCQVAQDSPGLTLTCPQ